MLPVSVPMLLLGLFFQMMTGNFSGEYLSQRAVSALSILKVAMLPAEDSRW